MRNGFHHCWNGLRLDVSRPYRSPYGRNRPCERITDNRTSLESPCLSHITDAPPDAPMGHALMASATLLHHHHHHDSCSHCSPSHHQPHNQDPQTRQIPTSGIERLLQLSASIPIEDSELTPVQAWELLRTRPNFGSLEVERLSVLQETLVRSVKCYG
jgi:hypothetical protein